MSKYVAPEYEKDGFNCPHCGAYAHQKWNQGCYRGKQESPLISRPFGAIEGFYISECQKCGEFAFWIERKLVYPNISTAPLPSEDIPADLREDFLEARQVVEFSPRSAAALLRLTLQKLMPYVGEKGKNLDDNIASLVAKGLSEKYQKALDTLRVIGNNAVHPGQIDIKDDKEIAYSLFEILNVLIENLITVPSKINNLYDKIPQHTKDAIKKRDAKKAL